MRLLTKRYYSSPYHFVLRENNGEYTLFFYTNKTLNESKKTTSKVKVPKQKVKDVKNYISNLKKSKVKKNNVTVKKELEELVNIDGVMSNSKIPILDPRLHPTKTMDQTVAAARITNDPITRGYRTYYGESVDEELDEIDLSGTFGGEETRDLDGKETYEYYLDELGDEEEAKNRTAEQGKDWRGKKDEVSEYSGDTNFISRQTIYEIQKQRAIKVLEDILTKKDDGRGDLKRNDVEVSKILQKNLKSIKRQANREGLSLSDLIKFLKSE